MDFKMNFDSNDLERRLGREMKRVAGDHLDRVGRELQAFYAQQKGRAPVAIQRDYKAKFGKQLSGELASLLSQGAPVRVETKLDW